MEREIKYINKKAVAILRVSSARQEDNFSHAVQLKYAKEYCERDTNNQKLDLVRVFTLVESAKDPEERKQYNEAMTFISKNKIGNVIFYMPDREARNSTDLETNARKVKRGEFILHYAHDRKCFHKGTPSGERLSRAIHGALNGNYSDVLAERIFDGTTEKAEQGWYPGSHPPLGYINKHDTDPVTGQTKKRGCTIAVDPNGNNVRIVLREYELRAQGLSLEDIRQKIKEEGLLTEKQKLTYRTSTISERLRNPFYRGQFQWYEKMYPGKHELFIPKKLRDAVDRAMNLKASAIVREESEHTILMGGWLKCSCGCNIVYDPKVKILKTTGEERTYHYCHCTNGTQAHETQKGLITTTDKVWNQFGALMDEISISEEFAQDIADALNKLNSKTKNVIHIQQAELNDKCKELEAHEDRLTEHLLNGTIDKEAYSGHLKRIRGNREDLLGQLEHLRLSLQDTFMESVKSILELATSAKSLWIRRSAQERKEFLKSILSNQILDGVTVRFELKKPFAVLVKMNENPEKDKWCAGLDDFRTACQSIA